MGKYFQRIHGPIYGALVKGFWKNADCDDLHIVSNVIGQRIIIIENSITYLLGLELLKGKRTFGMEFRYNAQKNALRPLLFKNYTAKKKDTRENICMTI